MEKIQESFKKALESKTASRALAGGAILGGAILIFSFGVTVGVQKASFGQTWSKNYYENFGVPTGKMLGSWDADDFPNANGAIGKIINTKLPNIIVHDSKDNIEKIISIDDNTRIQKGKRNIRSDELEMDDYTITIGKPKKNGTLEAKLIRVMPNPESLREVEDEEEED